MGCKLFLRSDRAGNGQLDAIYERWTSIAATAPKAFPCELQEAWQRGLSSPVALLTVTLVGGTDSEPIA